MRPTPSALHLSLLLLLPVLATSADRAATAEPRPSVGPRRSFAPLEDESRRSLAICYGPHRDGQRPGGPSPTADQLREDLHLMQRHWPLLRTYGASEFGATLLEAIRADELDMKVMLGAWIADESLRDADGAAVAPDTAAIAANRREVDAAIALANAYPDVVVAVCVGNETQVSWSPYPCPLDLLIGYVREVRQAVSAPVTASDDYLYWLEPASRELAAEIDFVTTHAHPLWNGQQLADALPWLRETVAAVDAAHPDHPVVIGETGWATSVATSGEQARLIEGAVGAAEQATFYRDLQAWAHRTGMLTFVFEAFDEAWKGGDDPIEVEKHWGLFHSDRTPKAVLAGPPGG